MITFYFGSLHCSGCKHRRCLPTSANLGEVCVAMAHSGDEGIKTLVQVTVQELVLKGCRLSGGKSQLSLCFQRGLKHKESKEREVVLNADGKDVVLNSPFGNDAVSIVTTLVRDSTRGVFLEKHGKLIIRRTRPGVLGFHTGFQGIATAQLPLHSLLADYSMQKVTLELVNCIGCVGGSISIVINPKFISEVCRTLC